MHNAIKQLFQKNRPFFIKEAADILGLPNDEVSKILSRYAKQGRLKRIKSGLYLPVNQRMLTPDETFSDPWVIIPYVFPNAYIGGWSATSHWGLTEQLFEDTCLLTPNVVHKSVEKLARFSYFIFKIPDSENFATNVIWRDQTKVSVSDVHKTVIDIIGNPKCGAGIQHTIDCFKVYCREFLNEEQFYNYAQKINNGAFFKRLGYLSEAIFSKDHQFCALATSKLTKGNIPIDATLECPKLVTKWNLFIPRNLDL